MVKLICTDIDGTLLNKNREVDAYAIEVFKVLDKNILVVPASSRMPKALYHIQESLAIEHMPLICYNGALILSSGENFNLEKVISSVTIPRKSILDIMELAGLHHVHISIYQDNNWFASEMDFYAQREITNTRVRPDGLLSDLTEQEFNNWIENGAHKIMLMGKSELIDVIQKDLSNDAAIAMWRSKDIYLEITPHTNKGAGLKILLNALSEQHIDISPEETMCFGDGLNDMELLTEVKFGIAVDNAVPGIKQIAYAVTKSNIEHGVAVYVDDFFNLNIRESNSLSS